MNINIIVATDNKLGIGKDNSIPWNIPADMKYFKQITTEGDRTNIVIMGRKTWDSLPVKPLPNRRNFVLTKNNFHTTFPDGLVLKEPDYVLTLKKIYGNIWIIGGQSIYEEYIGKPYIDRLYLTEIEDIFEGDTFFPEIPSHFHKTIQGKAKFFKRDATKISTFNINVYSNCLSPWISKSYIENEVTNHNKDYQ